MQKLIPDKMDKIALEFYLDNIEEIDEELISKLKNLLLMDTSISINEDIEQYIEKIVEKQFKNYEESVFAMHGTDDSNLQIQMIEAVKYNNHVFEEKDGSFSIYPSLDKNNYPFIKEVTNYLVCNNTTIEKSKKQITNMIINYNSKMKEKLMNGKLNTYYGNSKYLIERIAIINNGMLLLKNENLSEEEKNRLNYKLDSLSKFTDSFMKITSNLEETKYSFDYKLNKEEYDILASIYKEYLSAEKELSDISGRLWNEYMNENNIRLVHSLSAGVVSTDKMDKICTTVSSSEHFQAPYGNVGYEYNLDMSHIYCISPEDVGSWKIKKEDFISDGVCSNWQYDETGLFYESGNHSKLLPPDYVYNISKKYTTNNSYSEVIINNKDRTIKPVAAFITEDATEEEITKIKEIAEEENLDIVYRTNVKRRNNNESKFL